MLEDDRKHRKKITNLNTEDGEKTSSETNKDKVEFKDSKTLLTQLKYLLQKLYGNYSEG